MMVDGFRVEDVPATESASRVLRKIENGSKETTDISPIGKLLWPGVQSTAQATIPSNAIPEGETKSPVQPETSMLDREIERELELLRDPSNWYQWVVDTASGEPVAYGWWQHAKGQSEEEWKASWERRWRPPEMNHALADARGGARFWKRAGILGSGEAFILKELFVLHEFQRRGLGSMLLTAGLARADELHLLAYTEATPKGLQLYLRRGFVEVDRVTIHLEEWGGEKGVVDTFGLLSRKPT